MNSRDLVVGLGMNIFIVQDCKCFNLKIAVEQF